MAIKGILIQGIPVEPKRQGVPRSNLLFDLVSRGKPYLRGEGCPYIYCRSPATPLCSLS
jgi:hypothetical protein